MQILGRKLSKCYAFKNSGIKDIQTMVNRVLRSLGHFSYEECEKKKSRGRLAWKMGNHNFFQSHVERRKKTV